MIKEIVGLPKESYDKSYDIIIENGLLDHPTSFLEPYTAGKGPVAVVTDEKVWACYGKAFVSALREAGVDAREVLLEPGEQSKSMKGLAFIYDAFAGMKLKRDNLAVALGGGVVGDLCGFAAATYLRGVPYIQIPSTLLAQVDSSVGGKTAINLEQGKNLAGAFYQPRLVAIDPLVLRTLPDREYRCGMAEVIKYGAIRSRGLFNTLRERPAVDDLPEIIALCCRIKSEIVVRDERDIGERMLLNFGHTFGHAIEKAYQYETYNHGEAVAAGMALAAGLGEELEITQAGTMDELTSLLEFHGLQARCPCPPTELLPFVGVDKKSRADDISMVFLKRIGEAFVKPLDFDELGEAVRKLEEKWKMQR